MRPPPKRQPPPHPPDEVIHANVAELLRTPTLIDCGAEGHIVRSLHMLDRRTVQPSSMVTEAFSGAKAPITHTGDHVSGLFPGCHVVPQTTYNLFAVGSHTDNNPNCAVVLTATSAIELDNFDFDRISEASDPRAELITQLAATDPSGEPVIPIRVIGTRTAPGGLYFTNLFDAPALRPRMINAVKTGVPWDPSPTPSPASPSPSPKQNVTSQPIAGAAAHPDPTWSTSTTTERALLELRYIHCAMGHPSNAVLLRALANSKSAHLLSLRKYVKLMDKCNACPAGTQKAEPHSGTAATRATEYLARLFLDCSGRQPVASLGGYWYFLLIIDDATRMKWIRLLKSVSQVAAIFDNFLRTVVRQGTLGAAGKVRSVQLVRTDNGPDFNSNEFRQVLQLHSITHEPSPPDASAQRGVVERGIGVTSEIGRGNLFWAVSPLPFWGEAVKHAAPTSNNLPNSSNPENKTPFAMANPLEPPQLHKLRPFGCLTFTLVKTKDRNGKLNSASTCGFLCGYGLTPDGKINGYRVLNFNTQRITTKFNVQFNVHLPALHYILSALVNSPQQMLVGRTITKRFAQGTFKGTVAGYSTKENVTLYDIKYHDGDAEQMTLMELLRHISPIQNDMSIHPPAMHKRLQMATPSDRARIGKDVLPPPVPTRLPVVVTPPANASSKLLLRRSTRKKAPPNRLTSTKAGTNTNSSQVPLLQKTHSRNKANAATIPQHTPAQRWRDSHTARSIMINMVSRHRTKPVPNATIDGIQLHRYSTESPPLPAIPARDFPKPTDYDDAVYGKYRAFWRPPIQREIDSLFRYRVWTLEPLQPGALVLPCKMVLKVKPNGMDPPGIDKLKARYCGKGYLQKKGVHFKCAHANVAAEESTRLIVAIATELGWPIHGMDVSNAYLNADLDPDTVLYVQPPPTVHVPPGYGLRLRKGLYGTMQGGNRWMIHKHARLTILKFARNVGDPSIYHRHDSHGIVLMSVIVDDFQITGHPPMAIARAKAQLSQTWDMTDLGPLRYFANVEIKRDATGRQTTMKQTHYIEDMLAKYGLADTYGKDTPCTTAIYNQRLLDPTVPYPPIADDNYSNQLGTLGYLRRTRPDLCVALGVAGQFAKRERHGPQHYRALRNIMRYCLRYKHYGLYYCSSFKLLTDPWDVSGHVDSDWAAWKGTRRSRSGWLIYLMTMLICFGSKLQTSVAKSSAEAEYMALSLVIRKLLWLIHIIECIPGQRVRRPVPIYIDNKPAINLANNYAASKFTRHIGIEHHFIRQHCESGSKTFKLIWRNSENQQADGMTKPLPKSKFAKFRDSVVSNIEL